MGFDSRRLTVPPLNSVVVQLTLSWLWASIDRESIDFVLSVGLASLALGALEDVRQQAERTMNRDHMTYIEADREDEGVLES